MGAKNPEFPYVDAKEAMKMLDRDRSTVLRYGRENRIQMVHRLSGGTYLFDRASVEKLAAELKLADEIAEFKKPLIRDVNGCSA